MKIRDFLTDEYDYQPQICDFENFFDVYEDNRDKCCYNLNEGLYMKVDANSCQKYTTRCDMFWPLISYNIYGTPRLAWLLCKINDIRDPMVKISAGTEVSYISKQDLGTVLQETNN